jgi:hypothetical protein
MIKSLIPILVLMQLTQQRNALVIAGEPGYRGRPLLSTENPRQGDCGHAQGCCEYHPRFPHHNRSVGDLADEIGKLCAEIADLEARRKVFREELIRRDVAEAEGALFRATVSEAVRWTIDSAEVKAEMGEAWWNARCRQSLVHRCGQRVPQRREGSRPEASAYSPTDKSVAPTARNTAGLLASFEEHRA